MPEKPLEWKLLMNIDPDMTKDPSARTADLEKWLKENYAEGRQYRKAVAGVFVDFYVLAVLHDEMTQRYIAHKIEAAGGEAKFNMGEAFKYSPSYNRSVKETKNLSPRRNKKKD